MNYVAGGVGRAIMFSGNQLWGIANTLNDNTFDFTITAEDIRGGRKNVLLAQYFHDSNLSINLTNALFNFDEIALTLGATIKQGGLNIKEESVTTSSGGVLTPTETPISVDGETIGWYKLPSAKDWTVATFTGGTITGLTASTTYCVKYFFEDEDARSFGIRADYQPAEIHLVILQDLFTVEKQDGNVVPGSRAGVIVTDIPRFQLNGAENLSFAAGSTAGTSLAGNALAVNTEATCEDDYIYGTMTESIDNSVWQDNVRMIAVEDSDIELTNGETTTLSVYAVFGAGTASQRKANSNFTFAVDSGTSATVTSAGVVTASASVDGVTYISVSLTGYAEIDPAIVKVTVA